MNAALLLGTLLALGALGIVLYPLFFPPDEPEREGLPMAKTDDEGDARERAVPRDDDAVEAALRAYRATHAACPRCGPRPEADARFCSNCGAPLPG